MSDDQKRARAARIEKYARAICARVELPGMDPDKQIKDDDHGSTYHPLWEEHDDDFPMVIVCQGPPRCELESDEAVKAQQAGCVWCRRIRVMTDGSEHEQGPGSA